MMRSYRPRRTVETPADLLLNAGSAAEIGSLNPASRRDSARVVGCPQSLQGHARSIDRGGRFARRLTPERGPWRASCGCSPGSPAAVRGVAGSAQAHPSAAAWNGGRRGLTGRRPDGVQGFSLGLAHARLKPWTRSGRRPVNPRRPPLQAAALGCACADRSGAWCPRACARSGNRLISKSPRCCPRGGSAIGASTSPPVLCTD